MVVVMVVEKEEEDSWRRGAHTKTQGPVSRTIIIVLNGCEMTFVRSPRGTPTHKNLTPIFGHRPHFFCEFVMKCQK